MKRVAMLWLVLSGCGTLFNVGDDSRIGQKLLSDGGRCSGVVCALYCEDGFKLGPDGCEICACNPPPTVPDAGQCSGVVCALYCEYGFQKGADGCEICACNPAPRVQCGPNLCATGEECCNESCGICVAPGGGCTKQYCGAVDAGPGPTKCGPNMCAAGEECCNESCGICTPPGGACTQQACAPVDGGSAPTQCGFNTCAPGLECCNASCGICVPPGFACTQQACACSGVVCALACQYGFARGADGCEKCECAPAPQSCGNVTCNAGLECCNASCGICVAPGMACTQQACN